MTERGLFALGVVAGSGAAWKAAANVVSAPAMAGLKKAGDVHDEVPRRKPNVLKRDAKIELKASHSGGAVTYRHKTLGYEVRYNRDGWPDFTPYKYSGPLGEADVKIELTGNRTKDFELANKKAGFGDDAYSHPSGYIWHHHEDVGRMILVREDVHGAFPHTGGFALHKKLNE